MEAMCSDGEAALSMFEKTRVKALTKEIHWTKGRVVILDNWRVLHGRGGSSMNDGDRVLHRVTTI
jgi:alpha-ketoglutarate-dependent taurine dioxygenase